jgi:hypothetical protein
MKKLLLVCALAIFAVLPALAADNPWIGTWTLDLNKSHFTGNTFTYSKAANGMMHFSDGSVVNFDFAIDGKEYKTVYNRTTTWTTAGDNAWDNVIKADGKVLFNARRQLSADSKTLTITSTGTRPDGTAFKDETIYTRVTGTTGLVGMWRSTKVTISAPDSYVVSSPSPGIMHWDIPAYKQTVEGKFDGTDLPIIGPDEPSGLTIAIKPDSPTKLSYIVKVNGKPDSYGVQTLAADGKSFTDVSWNAGKPDEKATGVYVKQ